MDCLNLLTVPEVADRLGVHSHTVRRWIDRGDLPAVRLGDTRTLVRVVEADLDAYVATRRAEAVVA